MLLFGVGMWPLASSAPVPPAPAVFSDDFNRADGDLGSNWTKTGGTATAAVSSQICRWATGTDSAYMAPDTGSAFHFAEAQQKFASSYQGFYVCINMVDHLNYMGFRNRAGASQIYSCVNGTLTLLGSAVTQSIDTVVRLYRDGNTATAAIVNNDQTITPLISNVTIPTELRAATRAGFLVRTDSITALDSWRSGAL